MVIEYVHEKNNGQFPPGMDNLRVAVFHSESPGEEVIIERTNENFRVCDIGGSYLFDPNVHTPLDLIKTLKEDRYI